MTVPTETESEIVATVESVRETGTAHCRLCGAEVYGDSMGEILESLAEHGENEHEWSDRDGWKE